MEKKFISSLFLSPNIAAINSGFERFKLDKLELRSLGGASDIKEVHFKGKLLASFVAERDQQSAIRERLSTTSGAKTAFYRGYALIFASQNNHGLVAEHWNRLSDKILAIQEKSFQMGYLNGLRYINEGKLSRKVAEKYKGSSHKSVKHLAAILLTEKGFGSAENRALLRTGIHDARSQVRSDSISALANDFYRSRPDDEILVLEKAVYDKYRFPRSVAISEARKFQLNIAHIPALEKLAKAKDSFVRKAAAEMLATIRLKESKKILMQNGKSRRRLRSLNCHPLFPDKAGRLSFQVRIKRSVEYRRPWF